MNKEPKKLELNHSVLAKLADDLFNAYCIFFWANMCLDQIMQLVGKLNGIW